MDEKLELPEKKLRPETVVFLALTESRWVYRPASGEGKQVFTAEEHARHLEAHPQDASCFRQAIPGVKSGIVPIIAAACDLPEPSISMWRSGKNPIAEEYLPTISKVLRLSPAEKKEFYFAVRFGSSDYEPGSENLLPAFDSQQYKDASSGDLLRRILQAYYLKTDGSVPETIDELREAIAKGAIVIKSQSALAKEAENNPDLLLEYHRMNEQQAALGRQISAMQGAGRMLDVLELFVPATYVIAVLVKSSLLENEHTQPNHAERDFIFSAQNLLAGDVPKHQGAILSDLRRAASIHETTGEVKLWHDVFQDALIRQELAPIREYAPLTLEKLGKALGVTGAQVDNIEQGRITMTHGGAVHRPHLHLPKLEHLFSLAPEQMEIWRSAPLRADAGLKAWPAKKADGSEYLVRSEDYIRMVEQYTQQMAGSSGPLALQHGERIPNGAREVPGGLRGLKESEREALRRD